MRARKADVLPFTREHMAGDWDIEFFAHCNNAKDRHQRGEPDVNDPHHPLGWRVYTNSHRYVLQWAKRTPKGTLALCRDARFQDPDLVPFVARISKKRKGKPLEDIPRGSATWREHVNMLKTRLALWVLTQNVDSV